MCRSHMAIRFKRPALCATIAAPGIADSCYLGIAMAQKDAGPCAAIKSEKLRQVCETAAKAP